MKKLNCTNTAVLSEKICELLLKEKRRATIDTPDDIDQQLYVTTPEELQRYFPNK